LGNLTKTIKEIFSGASSMRHDIQNTLVNEAATKHTQHPPPL